MPAMVIKDSIKKKDKYCLKKKDYNYRYLTLILILNNRHVICDNVDLIT